MLLAYRPASWANFSKATELYQPPEAGLSVVGGLSKKMPTVAAWLPKAAVILEASPYPAEAPMMRTRLGPSATLGWVLM